MIYIQDYDIVTPFLFLSDRNGAMSQTQAPQQVAAGSQVDIDLPGWVVTYEGKSGSRFRVKRTVPIFTCDPHDGNHYEGGQIREEGLYEGIPGSHFLGRVLSHRSDVFEIRFSGRSTVIVGVKRCGSAPVILRAITTKIDQLSARSPITRP